MEEILSKVKDTLEPYKDDYEIYVLVKKHGKNGLSYLNSFNDLYKVLDHIVKTNNSSKEVKEDAQA